MKPFLFIFLVSLYSTTSYAADVDTQIDKACLRHAVSLVAKLKTEVIANISQEQSDKALKLATDSCQAYFKKEFSNTTVSSSNVSNASESSESKTSTKSESSSIFDIFDSEVKRKPGNERLNKRRY